MGHALDPGKVRVDGWELGDSTTSVHLVGPLPSRRRHRLNTQQIPRGTDKQSWAGRELPNLVFRLVFHGTPSGVKDWGQFALDVLDTPDSVITVEGSDPLWRGENRLPTRVVEIPEDLTAFGTKDRLEVDLRLTAQGVWEVDGGAYFEETQGWFKKTATGWERDDGATFTDAEKPRVRLPQQYSSTSTTYPLFVKQSDLSEDTPTVLEHFEVDDDKNVTRRYTEYDATGFLHPTPSATGDVGRYYAKVVPAHDWLIGELPPESDLGALVFGDISATGTREANSQATAGTLGLDAITAAGTREANSEATAGTLGLDAVSATGTREANSEATAGTLGLDAISATATTEEALQTEAGEDLHTESAEVILTQGT